VVWLWVVGIVVVVGAVTVVAVGTGAALGDVYEDRPDHTVPVGRPLAADDLRDVTFSTAVRGYRMDEVDALLERIRADLLARETHAPPSDDRPVDGDPVPEPLTADAALGPLPGDAEPGPLTADAEPPQDDPSDTHPSQDAP
jgi:DivIVA domain-containing protein